MPINRAPFNALVDDSGNGTSGSIWNKAAIQNVLLDPIDAIPTFQNVPFSAGNFGAASPMVWTVGAGALIDNRYAVIGKSVLIWSFYISWFSGSNVLSGSPTAQLFMTIPGGKAGASTTILALDYCAGIVGVNQMAGLQVSPSGGGYITISKANGSNYALSDIPGMVTTLIFEVF